jgi:hypothetical protein
LAPDVATGILEDDMSDQPDDDGLVEIELDLEPELIEAIHAMAIEHNLTFDQMVQQIIQAAIDKESEGQYTGQ